MQSRRAGPAPRAVTPERLDLPLREAMPELGGGLQTLRKLGIRTPREALLYLPFRYDDFSNLRPLAELVPGEKQSARVRVDDVRAEPGFGRRPPRTIAQLSDRSGSAEAIWFGRRFIEKRLRPGDEIVVSGKVAAQGWRMQFANPEFSPATRESVHTARVVPVYRLVSGVTLRRVRELLARVLDRWNVCGVPVARLLVDHRVPHSALLGVDSSLAEDTPPNRWGQLFAQFAGDGHPTRLHRMAVLPVAATSPHPVPAVRLDESDGIADLGHAQTIARCRDRVITRDLTPARLGA
jgi:hypothetical protein